MNSILKVSAATLGAASLASLFAVPAQAASITQLIDADTLLFSTGGPAPVPGLPPIPPILSNTISLPDAPLFPFDTSLGTLNSVILEGAVAGGFEGDCLDPVGCTVTVSFDLAAPGFGVSESDSFSFETGPDPESVGIPPSPFGLVIAPDFLALSDFEDAFFDGPTVIPADALSLTIGVDPGLVVGSAGLDYDLSLTYEFTPVPEPATTAGLVIAGGLGFLAKRKKSAVSSDSENT